MDTPHKCYIDQEGQAGCTTTESMYDLGYEPSDDDELQEY